MKEFEPVIGLEVHVQLATNSKMFCRCPNSFGEEPNSLICPVCTGMPGALPVLNKNGINLGMKVALALNCSIERANIFERKNYFYPDLPKGYQVSQLLRPLGYEGYVDLGYKKVLVNRAHLEEDAGKLIHQEDASYVDLNRCGVPLLEIVTEPDIFSSQEAYDYLTALKLIVQYVGGSSCDMEKGFLRCDANVSLREKGTTALGTKTEIKNLNSFKAVKESLEFEIKRQRKVLIDGGEISQETRLWDEEKRKTLVMRSKEEAHDYRYFPEPDLVTYTVGDQDVENASSMLGELPREKTIRFIEKYGLNENDVGVLVADKIISEYFEKSLGTYNNPKKVCNWLVGPMFEAINDLGMSFDGLELKADFFAKLVKAVEDGKVNNLAAKDVLRDMLKTGKDPEVIIEEKGLGQVNSSDELIGIVEETLAEHPQAIDEYKAGKEKSLMFLVGQVMRKSKGRANPKVLQELFIERIK